MGDIQNIQEEIFVIFHACSLGRSDVIKNAISQMKAKCPGFTDADIAAIVSTRRQEDDISPLHLAAIHGHSDVIRSLLNVGADSSLQVRVGEYEGKKPYDIANESSKQTFHVYFFEQVAMGKLPAISLLLRSGISINIRDNSKANDTLLHWACSFNNIDVVKLLISYGGIDVNIINGMGQTSLFLACKNENVELVELLLLEGASANHTGLSGQSAIDSLDHKHIVEGGSHRDQIQQIIQFLKSPPEPTKELHRQYLDMIQREQEEEENRMRKIDNEDDRYLAVVNGLHDDNHDESPTHSEYESNNGNNGNNHDDGDDEGYHYSNNRNNHNHNSHDDHSPVIKESSQLVLWPPTQNQSSQGRVVPLVLSSASNLVISLTSTASPEIDMYPLLLTSGLLNIFDKFGFQVQVKRSAYWAKIKLSIDANLCPGRQAFRLSIEPDSAILIASDTTGLLYAIYALIQLLQLHSEVILRDNVTTVYVPPVTITDRPDVTNRAVLWAYRSHARMQTSVMKETIELLSKLRINMVFLSIDVWDEDNHSPSHNRSSSSNNGSNMINNDVDSSHLLNTHSPSSPISNGNKNRQNNNMNSTSAHGDSSFEVSMSRIYSLDQLCRSHCIELVPSLTFTSHSQTHGLTVDLLRNFSHKMISLNFLYEPTIFEKLVKQQQQQSTSSSTMKIEINNGTHVADNGNSSSNIITLCQQTCEKILLLIQQADITSIHLCCNEWTRKSAAPYSIASKLGFNVIEHSSIDDLFPPSLFLKPVLVSMGAYVRELIRTSHNTSSILILPAFMETDILYPSMLLKYIGFLFAGLAWNSKAVIDMLDVGAKTSQLLLSISISDNAINSSQVPENSESNRSNSSNTATATTPKKRNSINNNHHQQLHLPIENETITNNNNNNSISTVYCASIFREVASLILFDRRAAVEVNDAFSVLLNILTGEWAALSGAMATSNSSGSIVSDIKHNSGINQIESPSPRLSLFGKPTVIPTTTNSSASHHDAVTTTIISINSLAKTEQSLYCVLTATPTTLFIQSIAPTKITLSECLRYYRRLLSQSNWKRSSTSSKKGFLESFTGSSSSNVMMSPVRGGSDLHSSAVTAAGDSSSNSLETEMDELFCIMNILSIICRAAILSYIAYEKKTPTNHSHSSASIAASPSSSVAIKDQQQQHHHGRSHSTASVTHTASKAEAGVPVQLTWGELLQHLPPGSKSDIANQLLESMNHLIYNMKYHKFDQLWFDHNITNNTEEGNDYDNNSKRQSNNDNHHHASNHSHHHPISLIHHFKSQYLLKETPVIPLMAFFSCVSHTLPMPQSPEDTLMRLFPSSPF